MYLLDVVAEVALVALVEEVVRVAVGIKKYSYH